MNNIALTSTDIGSQKSHSPHTIVRTGQAIDFHQKDFEEDEDAQTNEIGKIFLDPEELEE